MWVFDLGKAPQIRVRIIESQEGYFKCQRSAVHVYTDTIPEDTRHDPYAGLELRSMAKVEGDLLRACRYFRWRTISPAHWILFFRYGAFLLLLRTRIQVTRRGGCSIEGQAPKLLLLLLGIFCCEVKTVQTWVRPGAGWIIWANDGFNLLPGKASRLQSTYSLHAYMSP